jgi:hypothetical protein
MPTLTSNHNLDNIQDNIIFLKNYVLLLEARLSLLRDGHSVKDQYSKNEVNILTYETLARISATKTKITKLEYKYAVELNQFFYDLEDVAENFESTLNEAKKKQKDDINLRHYLYSTNWQIINSDIIQKINFFKQLKSFLNDLTK